MNKQHNLAQRIRDTISESGMFAQPGTNIKFFITRAVTRSVYATGINPVDMPTRRQIMVGNGLTRKAGADENTFALEGDDLGRSLTLVENQVEAQIILGYHLRYLGIAAVNAGKAVLKLKLPRRSQVWMDAKLGDRFKVKTGKEKLEFFMRLVHFKVESENLFEGAAIVEVDKDRNEAGTPVELDAEDLKLLNLLFATMVCDQAAAIWQSEGLVQSVNRAFDASLESLRLSDAVNNEARANTLNAPEINPDDIQDLMDGEQWTAAYMRGLFQTTGKLQFASRQHIANGMPTIGVKSFNRFVSAVLGGGAEAKKHHHNTHGAGAAGTGVVDINKSLYSVIQSFGNAVSIGAPFIDAAWQGAGLHGGPTPVIRMSRLGCSKGCTDGLTLLTLCGPDLTRSTTKVGTSEPSVADWVTTNRSGELIRSISLSGQDSTTLRKFIVYLHNPRGAGASLEAIVMRLTRKEPAVTPNGKNVIFSTGIMPDGELNEREKFKLCINTKQLIAVRDAMEAAGGDPDEENAVLGMQCEISYKLPLATATGEKCRNGGDVYKLDFTETPTSSSMDTITADDLEVLRRYEEILFSLEQDTMKPGSLAMAIERALENQCIMCAIVSEPQEYITRDVSPLEFACKALCQRRLGNIMKLSTMNPGNFMGKDDKTLLEIIQR